MLIKNFGDDVLDWSFIILTVHMRLATQCPWASSAALQLLHDKAAGWCIGEYCPHKNVCPPQRVPDHSAAAQVLDLKAQVTVSVIRLKQCVVGVWAKELGMNTHLSYSFLITSISRKSAVVLNTIIFIKSESNWSAALILSKLHKTQKIR